MKPATKKIGAHILLLSKLNTRGLLIRTHWVGALGVCLLMMVFTAGCGYSLRNADDDRREKIEIQKLREGLSSLKSSVHEAGVQSDQATAGNLKWRTEVNSQLEEILQQLRRLQGRVEVVEHETSESKNAIGGLVFQLDELRKVKTQVLAALEKQAGGVEALLGRVTTVEQGMGALQSLSADYDKKLTDIAAQMTELTTKVPPAVNAHADELTKINKAIKASPKQSDFAILQAKVADLTDRLSRLGEKITSEVDEQGRKLRKTSDRLSSIESKLATE